MIDGITLTIEVSGIGIGYDIYASPSLLSKARIGTEITASIHHHITDVSESLYGFEDFEERRLFRELNKVNGVGGKTALALL
jgi:holliday junction DNA helicase RuvA